MRSRNENRYNMSIKKADEIAEQRKAKKGETPAPEAQTAVPDGPGELAFLDKFNDEPPASLEDIGAAFAKLLHLEDDMTMRALLAALIANRMVGADPVWLLLVAPSASAKTEFVMAADKIPGTYQLADITPNTFLSGMANGKRDPSLLTRLGTDVTLLQKDFTSVLAMRPDAKGEILSQLRHIFDGSYVKEFGTGISKRWKGRMGFISGVTLEIEQAIMTGSKLGDRFLYFRLPEIDDIKAVEKANEVMFKAKGLREDIQRKVCGYMANIDIPENPPDLPGELHAAIRAMCAFIVKARAPVVRDTNGAKDIIDVPIHEGPTRFYKEIASMAYALAVMRGGQFDWKDYTIVAKLAFDAIPRRRMRLMEVLLSKDEYVKTADLAQAVSLPTRTAHFVLDELECCKIAERKAKADSNAPDEWRMSYEVKRLMAYRTDHRGYSGDMLVRLKESHDKADEVAAKEKEEGPDFK